PLQVAQQRAPALGRLAEAVLHRDQLLGAVGARAHEHENAEPILLEADVEVNAVRPYVDVVAITQIPLPEALVLVDPDREQPADVRGREPGSLFPQQRLERLLEVARRQAAQVQDRQHLGYLRRTSHVWR